MAAGSQPPCRAHLLVSRETRCATFILISLSSQLNEPEGVTHIEPLVLIQYVTALSQLF